MLNKGEYVLDAVKTLVDLLGSRERQRIKKRQVFREITAQQGLFDRYGDEAARGAAPRAARHAGTEHA